jgi:hypothetical protein
MGGFPAGLIPPSSHERDRISRDQSRPQTVAQFLSRDGLISASLHRCHDGVPNEFREMRLACLAFGLGLGLGHGQKCGTDAEAFDQCVSPFQFVQRRVLPRSIAAN